MYTIVKDNKYMIVKDNKYMIVKDNKHMIVKDNSIKLVKEFLHYRINAFNLGLHYILFGPMSRM